MQLDRLFPKIITTFNFDVYVTFHVFLDPRFWSLSYQFHSFLGHFKHFRDYYQLINLCKTVKNLIF
jgi:hypothetical protein